ncbi:MAG: metallophosphoesterase family protein [Burkholderiales bacterium]|nr:metallophosphoesterase family protein [Burkholderiales bacterium]
MRWGVVSDIHGNLPALQAVVAHAGAVDGWLNLGDILSGPLWPAETADWLMPRRWPTIAGNHERQLLTLPPQRLAPTDAHTAGRLTPAHRQWLASLPPALEPGPGLHCVHGSPRSDLEYLLETVTPHGLRPARRAEVAERLGLDRRQPDAARRLPPQEGPARGVVLQAGCARLVLCGHSHLPRDRRLGALRLVNPGSVGLPAFDDDRPFEHRAETGSPHARYALVEATHAGGWRVSLRAVAYDWDAAAARAEAQGRGDWADALRSGRVGRLEREVVGGRA